MSPPEKPKQKRNRKPAVRRDNVITALVSILPGLQAEGFTRAQRVVWLRQMAMAMDLAYGVDTPIPIDEEARIEVTSTRLSQDQIARLTAAPAPAGPPQPLHATADADEIRYYVDAKGYARQDPGGKRIDPFDIPNGADLEDEREGDDALDTINWKSGQFPPAAYPDKSFNIVMAKG